MGTIDDLLQHLEDFSDDLGNLKNASANITPDANGMIEKQCSKDHCFSIFSVNVDDWLNILRDEEVFCPICKKPDLAENFTSSRHIEIMRDQLENSIKQRWDEGTPIQTDGIVIESSIVPTHLYKCESCTTRYGTYTSANVCPSCGI